MRILFVNASGQLGGAERILLDLAAELRRRDGLSLRLLLLDDGPLRVEMERLGVEVRVVPMPEGLARVGESGQRLGARGAGRLRTLLRLAGASPSALAHARRTRTVLRLLRPDLVHSNTMKSHVLTALLRPRRTPLLWHLHDFVGERGMGRRLLKRLGGRGVRAIAISRAVAEDARAALPSTPVHLALNGIDTDHFSPGPADAAALDRLAGMAPAEPGVVRVGLIATYARWKGQDLFLQAAEQALRRGSAARFYVVGGPIYRTGGSQFDLDELRGMARALGIDHAVGFVPFQRDPRDAYRALDVVVHASTRPEPFGRTIVEAMACGRATVVSGGGGAAELFRDGEDALGFAPGDAGSLSAAMVRLAGDADLRARLGRAARATAERRFARRRMADDVYEIYAAASAATSECS